MTIVKFTKLSISCEYHKGINEFKGYKKRQINKIFHFYFREGGYQHFILKFTL